MSAIMKKALLELVEIPGPSGFERRIGHKMVSEFKEYVDKVWIDEMGNVIGLKKGNDIGNEIMMMAHMDEVSMVVRRIDEFVWFENVGWIDRRVLPGTPITILTQEKDVEGIICSPSAHFSQEKKSTKYWIDAGRQQEYISVGDPIVFSSNARWLDEEQCILASKAIDDRVGCAVLLDIARNLKEVKNNTYFVGSVQEEVGGFGAKYVASKISPKYLIAIDTTLARDPNFKNEAVGLSEAVVIRKFQITQPQKTLYPANVFFSSQRLDQALIESAKELGIPVSLDICRGTFTDTSAIAQINPEIHCSTLLIPRRYSHSPCEVVDMVNLERCSRIIIGALSKLERT